jgi:hypothetical protein
MPTFAPKREEVTGGWTELHNEDLHNLYSLSKITRRFKPRKMRWVAPITCIGQKRSEHFGWEALKGLKHLGMDGRILLKLILKK